MKRVKKLAIYLGLGLGWSVEFVLREIWHILPELYFALASLALEAEELLHLSHQWRITCFTGVYCIDGTADDDRDVGSSMRGRASRRLQRRLHWDLAGAQDTLTTVASPA